MRLPVLVLSGALLLPSAAAGESFIDQLGAAIRSGHIDAAFALAPGKVPLTGAWSIETTGTPTARLTAEAEEGHLTRMAFAVEGGDLIISGRGLRPDVVVQSVEAQAGAVTSARFHGRGFFGKIVIGLFRGVGMSAVKKMKLRTDLPSIFRGDVIVHDTKPGTPPPAAPAEAAAPPPPPATGPSLFDLVRTITVERSILVAFPDRPLAFDPIVRFETAKTGEPVRISIEKAVWTPSREGAPSRLELDGEVGGNFAEGAMSWEGDSLHFSSGELRRARIRIRSDDSGKSFTSLAAERVALDLTSGRFSMPAGRIRVGVEAPSRFSATSLSIPESGKVSGILDLDLRGKTGEWRQRGATVALANVTVSSKGLRIEENAATGHVALAFDYRLVYPFTMSYPVKEIEARRVDLVFAGPLTASVDLDRAGDPEHGRIDGTYVLRVPWAPVEQAAFEAMRAKWSEDLTAIRKVDFSLEPSSFGPCGESCFVAKFDVVAEKKSGGHSIFRAECAPEGRANLVIDKNDGTMRLEDMKIQTHCRGIAAIVNVVAPLFAKAYSDVTLFQMPPDSPLTVDSVRSGHEWIELAGRLQWSAAPPPGAPPAPPAPPPGN